MLNLKTNPQESINFLEEFTRTYEEENTVDTNDQTKKEESFQDFLKKLQ
jgi:flagellar biogenesis protein FliO